MDIPVNSRTIRILDGGRRRLFVYTRRHEYVALVTCNVVTNNNAVASAAVTAATATTASTGDDRHRRKRGRLYGEMARRS